MSNLAIIPARAGSKGLPGKNLVNFRGKPLIYHTIEAARQCKAIDKVVVTTDSYDIAKYAIKFCPVHLRPSVLGKDDVILAPVIEDVITRAGYSSYDTIFTLQPTSPLRDSLDIDHAILAFKLTDTADSLLSVTEVFHSLWKPSGDYLIQPLKYEKMNRQDVVPYFKGNGAIFISKRDVLINKHDRLGDKISYSIMPEWKSIDIHYQKDLDLANYYAEKYLV